MPSISKLQKNPKLWLGTFIAASAVAVSYKLLNKYLEFSKENDQEEYSNKSIALTLSNSVLSSQLPLSDILTNSENVTFILPPNLSIEDLEDKISNTIPLPKTVTQNYKLLDCSNLQGYYAILKNLQPDLLLVCADDLGVTVPKDMHRFVKKIITIDQNKDDVYSKIAPFFVR